jgi:hypothetical protein
MHGEQHGSRRRLQFFICRWFAILIVIALALGILSIEVCMNQRGRSSLLTRTPSGLSRRLSGICLPHVCRDTAILLPAIRISFRFGVATCKFSFCRLFTVELD